LKQAKAEERMLDEAIKEVASLPTRNDAAAHRDILLIYLGTAVFALLLIPMGLVMNSLEPAGAALPISRLGLLLALVSPFVFIYSLVRGIHYQTKRLDAQALCEFLLRYEGMFDVRASEPSGGVLSFIVPSHRKRYAGVFHSLYTICQAEVEKHGSSYAECHSWAVREGRDRRTATCIIVFVRRQAAAEGRGQEQPLGKLTLYAVMSNARNWYLCLPRPENFNTAFRLRGSR